MRKSKAQSILEYVIVLSAIVTAIIAMARGPLTNAVNRMFQDASNVITDSSDTFYENAARARARN
jgi:hypothetical protein